ncbi:MAG: phosphohistidine phosphatase SixA [Deltaproteobacteria bacterium]|nr:phosphohistidine phosphatase SixA [Deltaproteobacteria bacterium]
MAIYLVQHGKSLPEEIDPDRGLSDEGRSEVKHIADVAHEYGVKVSMIEHSEKTRARQTAEIFSSILKPADGHRERMGLKPLDDVTAVARTIESGSNIMLVGHQPFMGRLTSYLITGSMDTPVFKFQNGGILCLDRDPDTGSWIILWSLMPNIR